MNTDLYPSFWELARHEDEYRIRVRRAESGILIIAPHGGGIERGTGELAEAVAADDLSFYIFEGTKKRGNCGLHITSSNFDEPCCRRMLANAARVLTLHGDNRDRNVLFLGGLDVDTAEYLRTAFGRHGFDVRPPDRPHLRGLHPKKICNQGRSRAGVQIEIAKGLRRTLFDSLSAAGCQVKTQRFNEFVTAVREGIGHEGAL